MHRKTPLTLLQQRPIIPLRIPPHHLNPPPRQNPLLQFGTPPNNPLTKTQLQPLALGSWFTVGIGQAVEQALVLVGVQADAEGRGWGWGLLGGKAQLLLH